MSSRGRAQKQRSSKSRRSATRNSSFSVDDDDDDDDVTLSLAGSEVDDFLRSLPSAASTATPSKCLLDVLFASLADGDLKTAERLSAFTDDADLDPAQDLLVGSFIVRLRRRALLKEKFHLKLQIERNLDKAFCNRVPGKGVLHITWQ